MATEHKPGGVKPLRFIDTTDLPEGFDVADLLAQPGVDAEAALKWMTPRVRVGLPPAEKLAAVPKKEKAPPTQGRVDGAVASGGDRTTKPKPATVAERPSTPREAPAPSVPAVAGNVATLPVSAPQSAPEADEAMLPPEYSDDSLAREFTAQHGGSLAYVNTWGRWLQWDGQRWAHDETLVAQHAVRMVLREQANAILERQAEFQAKTRGMATAVSSARTMSAVERIARADPRHAARPEQFDADEWLLNTPGGIVDLKTGALRPATMADYCTKITRVAPEGECPTWLRFLDDVTNGNAELVAYLQRVAGYALTGSTREHALFFFYGTGRNGKGTFLNTIEWILRDYSRVADMRTFTESKDDRHPTELAALMGARIVTSQETDEGKAWAESRIKSMTGGDPITARFMRQDDFTFIPQFKLMISGNHRPRLRNVDPAFMARLHLIPFTVTVPPEKRDQKLPEKLRAEAGGILRWMVEGCSTWNRIGLAAPLAVRKATEDYFKSQDIIGQWLEDSCELGLGNRAKTTELYRSFEKYAAQSGEYSVSMRRWKDSLALKAITEVKSTGGQRMLKGVRLKPGREEAPEMF